MIQQFQSWVMTGVPKCKTVFALQLIVQQDYFMLFACENAEGEVMQKYREECIQNKINMRNLLLSDYCLIAGVCSSAVVQ